MTEILIAVAAVGAIGLIAGVILAVAGKFFDVPVDETVEQLSNALPGANCGGCGYSGCDGYAEAIKEGAPCNLCSPGGNETARALAAIMGVEAEECEKKTAVVRCRGTAGVTAKRFTYDGLPTCQAAALLLGGDNSCRFGCLGYGDCAAVCDNGGIRVVDGVARVDGRLCTACGKCVKICPRSIIELLPEHSTVPMCVNTDKGADTRKACKNGCIGCMRCEKICPTGAIQVKDFCAVIDPAKCDNCGLCAEACTLGVIYIRKEPS